MAQDKAKEDTSERRRPYRAPTLVDYGAVAKLTQGSLNVGADGGPGGMNAGCL